MPVTKATKTAKQSAAKETSLKLRYEWGTILTLSEDHNIDFFEFMANPLEKGITGMITVLVAGAQTVDPSLTRESVIEILRARGGNVGEELKRIMADISESMPNLLEDEADGE